MVTPRQNTIYSFIERHFHRYHCAPTLSEIATGIGIKSRSAVHRQVQGLISAGLLKTSDDPHRRLILAQKKRQSPTIPLKLVGTIAAGQPITAIAEPESLDLYTLLAGEHHFALRVRGDSMIEEGIFDGDIVVCQHADTADDGNIVVALIDGQEATLKRLRRDPVSKEIILVPANANLASQHYHAERVQIQGIFVGLLRLAR